MQRYTDQFTSPQSEPPAEHAAQVLAKALHVAKAGRSCGLILPRDRAAAIALAAAGAVVTFTDTLAHIDWRAA